MMTRVVMKVAARLYPIAKPSLTSSARCGCDNYISRRDKAAMTTLIILPNDAESRTGSSPHPPLCAHSAFILRKRGAASAAAETADFPDLSSVR